MNADKVIALARKHLGKGAMDSSARLALADSIALYDRGDFESAKRRALKSLSYSVGVFHADYKKAAAEKPLKLGKRMKQIGPAGKLRYVPNPVENRDNAMQAIVTKYIPASNTRGSRVKATTASGISLTVSYDSGLDSYGNHVAAAEALQNKMKWGGDMVGGATKDGYAFTFRVNDPSAAKRNPAPKSRNPGFAIYARKGAGPRMFYDGRKFTNNGKPKIYPSGQAALSSSRALLATFHILADYAVTVEPYAGK